MGRHCLSRKWHCIGYLHFGWKFGQVRLSQSDDGHVTGAVTSPSGRYDCTAYGIICLAGPLAEEKLTGVDVSEQTGSYVDIVMARDALSRVGPADIDSILPFTRSLIEHEWSGVQLIANHLVVHKRLDYEQVVKIIC